MRQNAAIGIVFNAEKNKVLLVKRWDVPVWVLPGGGIEAGEDPRQAVVREVLEETGLHVTIIRKVAEYTPINNLARFTEVYECAYLAGDLSKGVETREIEYFSINHLPQNLFFLHEEWILDALKENPEVIKRPLNNITYWNFIKYFFKHPTWVIRFLKTLIIKR